MYVHRYRSVLKAINAWIYRPLYIQTSSDVLTVYILAEEFWRSCKTRQGMGEIGEHEFDSAFNARSTASMLLRIITRIYVLIYLYALYLIIDRGEVRGEIGRANETRNFLRPLSFSLSWILRRLVITTVFICMLINIYQLFFHFFYFLLKFSVLYLSKIIYIIHCSFLITKDCKRNNIVLFFNSIIVILKYIFFDYQITEILENLYFPIWLSFIIIFSINTIPEINYNDLSI